MNSEQIIIKARKIRGESSLEIFNKNVKNSKKIFFICYNKKKRKGI